MLPNYSDLNPVKKNLDELPTLDGWCQFGAHVDNTFVLGSEKRKVNEMCDHICFTFSMEKL